MKPNDTRAGRRERSRDRNKSTPRATWTAVLLLALAQGCAGPPSLSKPQITQQEIIQKDSTSELESQIRDYVDFAEATVERVAVDLERKATSKEQRRATILFRVRMIAQLRSAAGQTDPREALLDLWALNRRTLDYLSTGAGKTLFEDRQFIALAAADDMYAAIERLAQANIAADAFERVKQDVVAYAHENPIRGEFAQPPAQNFSDRPEGEQALRQLIGLPFAPITALTGVGKTPESIREVSQSMDRFTDVVEDFPANARWQLQLLAMNLGEEPPISETVSSVRRVSESSSQLAASSTEFVRVAEKMPQSLRKEAEVLLDHLDASQPELRATIGEVRQSAAEVSTASDSIRESAIEIRGTVASVQEASHSLETAAHAVRGTAQEILKFVPATMKDETGQIIGKKRGTGLVAGMNGQWLSPESPTVARAEVVGDAGAADRDTSFSFQAVAQSANALGQTSDKLRDLLADTRALFEGGSLSREVGAVDQHLRSATDATSLRVRDIIDHAAKRSAQLLLFLFVLLAGYRFYTSRLRRPETVVR